MFVTDSGEKIFVIDGHVHLWDARPANRRNRYGATFIETFWNGHNGMSPPEDRWAWERFEHLTAERAAKDLFVDGYCDLAVMLPTYLYEFYNEGFNTTEQCAALHALHPDRVILNGRCDPRDGDAGLEQLEADHARWGFKGVKLYTAEWKGVSKGYSLKDPFVPRYMEKLQQLGVRNVHIHKGPTIHPLNMDAFDVNDVDEIATMFPDLNFIVDHCGMPRIEDFCWIANQEPNVYGGLALIPSFLHARPKYFQKMMVDLLFFVGPDRLIFGSDYAITSPKWIVEKFMAFEFDDEAAQEAGTELTLEVKRKLLGLNCARLYGIDPEHYLTAEPVAAEREDAA